MPYKEEKRAKYVAEKHINSELEKTNRVKIIDEVKNYIILLKF